MYNGSIRKIKIEKREGSLAHIKTLLKKSQIKIGDWVILKAKNLISDREVIFPANVRSNHKISIRKRIRLKLGLRFDVKTPIEFEIIKKLERIDLKNGEVQSISNNLVKILPNSLKIKDEIIKLNCFRWKNDKLLFSYQNSKSSNYIILDKSFTFDPFIAGLWRAEGGKYSLLTSALQFTNSNTEIIKKWMSFLRSLGLSSNDSKFSYYIQYISPKKDLEREETLTRFWSEKINVPKSQFGFIYKQGPGHKSKFYGSLQIKFNNSTLSFIIQYLFLKFEKLILLKSWDKDIVINYIKGTLCDCDCRLRDNKLHGITFSTSSKEEGMLIRNILYKYFGIFSRGHQDPRNKCYYVRITHYDNYLKFAKYGFYKSISWRGNNRNFNKFVEGFLNHRGSLDILKKEDKENKDLIYSVRSMYLQSMLKGNAAVHHSENQSLHLRLPIEV